MSYIVLVALLILLFLSLHYFTDLTTNQKGISIISISLIISSAILYNDYSDMQRDKMLTNVKKFNQHKQLLCNGIEVDDKNFSLSIGTYTLIGNKNTPHYQDMIDILECN